MKIKLIITALVTTSVTSNAATIFSGSDLTLGDGSGIIYSLTGDIATEADDGIGEDLRTTTNAGGSFTLTFSSAVDLTIFNTEVRQAVNFDSEGEISATVLADAGVFSYTAGAFDLTNGDNGDNALSGLGTNELTIGSARGFFPDGGIASGAPGTEFDFGEFAISGVTSLTYTFTDSTNIEGFRINAVGTAVPEPSSLFLVGLGGLALIARRKR